MSDPKHGQNAAADTGETNAAASAGAPPTAEDTEAVLQSSPYGRQERLMLVLLVVAIVVALGFMGWYVRAHANTLLPRAFRPVAQKVGLMARPVEMKLADPVGSPTAKVKAVVIMEHCLVPVQALLVSVGTEFPELVRAEFHPMYSPEAQQVMQQCQESCAGLFINGKNRFQVTLPGEAPKEVYFHAMPGAGYQLSDVVAVLKQEMAAAYGTAPADFDQRVVVPQLPSHGPSDPATPDAPPGAAPGGPAAGGPQAPPAPAPAAH